MIGQPAKKKKDNCSAGGFNVIETMHIQYVCVLHMQICTCVAS